MEMTQAMEMNDKPGGSGDMADGDEETPRGVPLPTPAQLKADLQSAHAALEEEEEQSHGGRSQALNAQLQGVLCCYQCIKKTTNEIRSVATSRDKAFAESCRDKNYKLSTSKQG